MLAAIASFPAIRTGAKRSRSIFDDPHRVSYNREFNIYTGTLSGEPVSVCSTGIGGPSTAIAVEELAACGVHTFIRIGTCGGISTMVRSGDCVIATGAVRAEGTSREYAPIEFPAVPDTDVLFALINSAKKLGPCLSHGRCSVQGFVLRSALPAAHAGRKRAHGKVGGMEAPRRACQRNGVCGALTVGAALGVRCGSVFHVVWNQERANLGLDTDAAESHDTDKAIRVAVGAISDMIANKTKVHKAKGAAHVSAAVPLVLGLNGSRLSSALSRPLPCRQARAPP